MNKITLGIFIAFAVFGREVVIVEAVGADIIEGILTSTLLLR